MGRDIIDKKNNLLFLTTGNPRPALIGTSRPGKNKNANSVIAIDLNQKKYYGHFKKLLTIYGIMT